MKKLFIVLTFLLLFSTAGFSQYTLSGYDPNSAKNMMKNFETAKEPYDKGHRNSFWISRNDFIALYKHLININANGVRAYFAKATQTGPTTLIFVATHPANGFTYADFFEKNMPINPVTLSPTYFGSSVTSFSGATLYDAKPPKPINEDCYNDGHHILAKDAHDMVQNLAITPIIKNTIINIHGELFTRLDPGSSTEGFLYDLNDELTRNTNLSGVRIYIARQIKIKPHDTEYRHCLIFITTTDNSNGIHGDYYECPALTANNIQFRKQHPRRPHPIVIYDNGEECPTACDGSAFYP